MPLPILNNRQLAPIRAPLLAPGILVLAGVIAIAATYAHPGLARADGT